ncbi:5-formyltetrahydrofolate cyclo-ligase [Hydrogenoanaerobacterium sp.]|uniref:5-formyltetrahydrofolate cyclo-ligase n=1 Tax=Hydrogenoanaerobacterium sp. TaxID=2953763 RepID=UPI0028A0FD5B|nr:5-formyltetrahydrofolate cyclo-ligase [Hydrogenoanaerobacterium sp.]
MTDIRIYKTNLRNKYKQLRRDMPPNVKLQHDESIRRRVQSLYQYKNAKTLLTFVSTEIEVDTRTLIADALRQGKQVAVPRCIDGTREMEFYLIDSLDDLAPRTFGVLEPDPGKCVLLTDFTDSVCIVPGLAFDFAGYRLGYGKGYYDRFLSGYTPTKIGIVYSSCMTQRLQHGRYDVAVNLLVTEKYLRKVNVPNRFSSRR